MDKNERAVVIISELNTFGQQRWKDLYTFLQGSAVVVGRTISPDIEAQES
jgi:hypothetical protein